HPRPHQGSIPYFPFLLSLFSLRLAQSCHETFRSRSADSEFVTVHSRFAELIIRFISWSSIASEKRTTMLIFDRRFGLFPAFSAITSAWIPQADIFSACIAIPQLWMKQLAI